MYYSENTTLALVGVAVGMLTAMLKIQPILVEKTMSNNFEKTMFFQL